MSKRKWIAAILALALVFLFVPFVPSTSASGSILGAHYQVTADVSPTYYFFHCGSYINSQVATQLGSSYSSLYQLQKGYTFTCTYQSQ